MKHVWREPRYRGDPQLGADAIAQLRADVFKRMGDESGDSKDWARVLRVRHESGEHLSVVQIDAYKRALGLER